MPIKNNNKNPGKVYHSGSNDVYFRWKNGDETFEVLYSLSDLNSANAVDDVFEEIVKEFTPERENCFLYSNGKTSKSYCAIELEENLMVSHSFSPMHLQGISVLFTSQTDKEKLKRVKAILRKMEKVFKKEFNESMKGVFIETDEIFEVE